MRDHHGLEHVCWLGGSACAGKSTVAHRLAVAHGLTLYSTDDHFDGHRLRIDPAHHPFFHRIAQRSFEALVMRPLAEQIVELEGFYGEQMGLIVEDLRCAAPAGAAEGGVLAEGVGLLPDFLADLPGKARALFLLATPAFRRRHYPRRGPWVERLLAQCEAPEEAFTRWMERDDEMARRIAAAAARLGFPVLTVDGERDLDETVHRAAELLALPTSYLVKPK